MGGRDMRKLENLDEDLFFGTAQLCLENHIWGLEDIQYFDYFLDFLGIFTNFC